MVRFSTVIKKFGTQGEKTGWTYIDIPAKIAERIKLGTRIGFRVKGKLDHYSFEGHSLMPMGNGDFILPLNANVRKQIRKEKGAVLHVQLEEDTRPFQYNKDFMESLEYEPKAKEYFDSLSGSHRHYFSKWIDSAKTEPTRVKRIAMAINALMRGWGYPEMMRAAKASKP